MPELNGKIRVLPPAHAQRIQAQREQYDREERMHLAMELDKVKDQIMTATDVRDLYALCYIARKNGAWNDELKTLGSKKKEFLEKYAPGAGFKSRNPEPETLALTDGEDTWEDVDPTDVLNGMFEPTKPDLMMRTDDIGLIYSGKLHSFHGESESGKSLVLLWEAARLMNNGEDVLWLDFDSDLQENVGRLVAFGVEKDVIREHFKYKRPEAGIIGSAGYEAMFSRTYALAVLDGVTDAMMLLSEDGTIKGDPNDAFTKFSRKLPRRLADETGAAVVMVDHVTKDAQTRGRFAIGAQAKMSQLTGAAYSVAVSKVFGRGMKGEITLYVGKDRPGGVRIHGSSTVKNQQQEIARITVDDTGDQTVLTINPYKNSSDSVDDLSCIDDTVERNVATAVSTQPHGLGFNQIMEVMKKAGHGAAQGTVREAISNLIDGGYVHEGQKLGRGLIPFTLIKAYAGIEPPTVSDRI